MLRQLTSRLAQLTSRPPSVQHVCTCQISVCSTTPKLFQPNETNGAAHFPSAQLTKIPVRWGSNFYNKSNASNIWKALTSVSPQGRQRGRAKGLMRMKNLHIGQRLGFGKNRVAFPGLAKKLIDTYGKTSQKAGIGEMSEETFRQYEERVEERQKQVGARKKGMLNKQSPLERGWTGGSPEGRKFGPPIPRNSSENFDGFESVLLHMGGKLHMTTDGRRSLTQVLMVTGNKNGTAGFAWVRSLQGRGPKLLQRSINKAGQSLVTVPLYENRTVYHDFFSNFGKTRVIVRQKPPGHGIQASRLVKSICDVLGIKDLEVVIEGADKNFNHITKAFFLGLMRQRTHQELADEKRLHLVEFREENDYFPLVVATPEHVRTKEELEPNEILDFEQIVYDGHLPRFFEEKDPWYTKKASWEVAERKRKPVKHHYQQRIEMLIRHGKQCSHLTEKFPECKPYDLKPRMPPEGWLEMKAKLDAEEQL